MGQLKLVLYLAGASIVPAGQLGLRAGVWSGFSMLQRSSNKG